MVVMPVAIVRLSANEVRRIVDAARPHVLRGLGVGTNRTCAGYHPTCHSGSDDLLWRDPLLDPLLERGQRIPRIGPSRGGSTAMPHIGQQEESDEVFRFVRMMTVMTGSGPNTVVVIDGVHRVGQWVGRTMPHDHLAAMPVEGGQIRVFRVVDELECLAAGLLVERKADVSVDIEGS